MEVKPVSKKKKIYYDFYNDPQTFRATTTTRKPLRSRDLVNVTQIEHRVSAARSIFFNFFRSSSLFLLICFLLIFYGCSHSL